MKFTLLYWTRTNRCREMGFWGAKVPLPFGPADGHEGLEKLPVSKNIETLFQVNSSNGRLLYVLTAQYAIQLAKKCEDLI